MIKLSVSDDLKDVLNQAFSLVSLVPVGEFTIQDHNPDFISISKASSSLVPMLAYIPPTYREHLEGLNPYNCQFRKSARIGKVIRSLITWYEDAEPELWKVQRITEYLTRSLYGYRQGILPIGYTYHILSDRDSIDTAYSEECTPYDSCMSKDNLIDDGLLRLYWDNPDIYGIGVLLDVEGTIQSRCIIHKQYMRHDRIYSRNDRAENLTLNYLDSIGYKPCYDDFTLRMHYNIDLTDYLYVPYQDTMRYYDMSYQMLHNGNGDFRQDHAFRNTDGYNVALRQCSNCHTALNEENEYIIEDERYCESCIVYSDIEQDYIPEHRSRLLYDNSYCYRRDSIQLYSGDYAHDQDENLMESIDGDCFIVRS